MIRSVSTPPKRGIFLSRIWLAKTLVFGFMSVVVFIEPIFGAEPYMPPYKDTMIIMTHGINADRYTWFKPDSIGDIDEANGDSNLWWHYLNKELQIPKGYLQSYSFSSRSGRHEANMLEFGYSGYHNPASGEVETSTGHRRLRGFMATPWLLHFRS